MNNDERLFFKKYTSHIICKVAKRLLKVLLWEGVGDWTKLQYIDPHSYGHHCCVFLVLLDCSTRGLGAQPLWDMFSFQHLLTNWSGLQTQSEGPEAPSARWWPSLPLLVSNFSGLQLTDFQSLPSYIIVQSPTQSLEWHVWSSSSGNNCHAVHRSLSSGASIYECTMGFLPCPIFSAKPASAISSHNCHRNVSLPSGASLWNGMFERVEGQYTTTIPKQRLLVKIIKFLHRLLFINTCAHTHIHTYHHHHVVPLARIFLTLTRQFSPSFIASGRS